MLYTIIVTRSAQRCKLGIIKSGSLLQFMTNSIQTNSSVVHMNRTREWTRVWINGVQLLKTLSHQSKLLSPDQKL